MHAQAIAGALQRRETVLRRRPGAGPPAQLRALVEHG